MNSPTETEKSGGALDRVRPVSSTHTPHESIPLETVDRNPSPTNSDHGHDGRSETDNANGETQRPNYINLSHVGPWPLRRNSSNCTVVGSGSPIRSRGVGLRNPFDDQFASQASTMVSSEGNNILSAQAQRRRSELTDALNEANKQCEIIQRLHEEEFARTNDAAETRRYVLERERRALREQRTYQRFRARQAGREARLEHAEAEADADAQEPDEVCETCVKYGGLTLLAAIILALSVIMIAVSPFILVKAFGDEAALLRDILNENGHSLWFLGALALPSVSMALVTYIAALGLAVHRWSHKGIEIEGAADYVRLVGFGVVFSFWFYAWCCASVYVATTYLTKAT